MTAATTAFAQLIHHRSLPITAIIVIDELKQSRQAPFEEWRFGGVCPFISFPFPFPCSMSQVCHQKRLERLSLTTRWRQVINFCSIFTAPDHGPPRSTVGVQSQIGPIDLESTRMRFSSCLATTALGCAYRADVEEALMGSSLVALEPKFTTETAQTSPTGSLW